MKRLCIAKMFMIFAALMFLIACNDVTNDLRVQYNKERMSDTSCFDYTNASAKALESNGNLDTTYDNESMEFHVWENGTLIGTGVSDEKVELVLAHFAAIENGDLSAFRDTLIAQDMPDSYHQMRLIVEYFGDLIGATLECVENEITEGSRGLSYAIFKSAVNPKPRNTELFVEKIHWQGHLRVVTTNKFDEEKVYWLVLYRGSEGLRVNRHSV